jgi:hypothetical protein
MSIWSIFTKSEPSLELDRPTIPTPPPMSASWACPDSAAPAVRIFIEAEAASVRPFAAEAIGALVTHRGRVHNYQRPAGRYSIVDQVGADEIRTYSRSKRADYFRAAVEASAMTEQFFNDGTFVPSNHQELRRAG